MLDDQSAPKMIEIRWHARGGQGAKTAATFLAESAVDTNHFAQGFPEYGPERMGAPIRAFNRIANVPIRRNMPVTAPDIVLILDDSLMETVDIAEGATENTVFVLNTTRRPSDALRTALHTKIGEKNRIFLLDANKVAKEEIGRPIPNTPMVGAMQRATGLLPFDAMIHGLRAKLSKKYPPKIVDGNVTAMRRAYAEVQEL